MDTESYSGQLKICINKKIRRLMREFVATETPPEHLKAQIQQLQDRIFVPWGLVDDMCQYMRTCSPTPDGGPWLHKVCKGSLQLPPLREARQYTPEFKAHLAKLQEQLDNKRYQQMVADIAPKEEASIGEEALLPSTRLQLAFGAHVLVTMGTGFALAYYVVSMLGGGTTMAASFGALGMTAGMLLETFLFIVRSNAPPSLERKYPHLFKDGLREPLESSMGPPSMDIPAKARSQTTRRRKKP